MGCPVRIHFLLRFVSFANSKDNYSGSIDSTPMGLGYFSWGRSPIHLEVRCYSKLQSLRHTFSLGTCRGPSMTNKWVYLVSRYLGIISELCVGPRPISVLVSIFISDASLCSGLTMSWFSRMGTNLYQRKYVENGFALKPQPVWFYLGWRNSSRFFGVRSQRLSRVNMLT